jgi:hypothetical protein
MQEAVVLGSGQVYEEKGMGGNSTGLLFHLYCAPCPHIGSCIFEISIYPSLGKDLTLLIWLN